MGELSPCCKSIEVPIFRPSKRAAYSKESIPPACVAWRADTANRVVVSARQVGNRFPDSLKVYKYGLRTSYRNGEDTETERVYLLILEISNKAVPWLSFLSPPPPPRPQILS
jgi:hypothetical protein